MVQSHLRACSQHSFSSDLIASAAVITIVIISCNRLQVFFVYCSHPKSITRYGGPQNPRPNAYYTGRPVMVPIFASIAATYAVFSFVLLKKPYLLHAVKHFPFKAQHICHRGGAGEYIENSMDAFRHGIACRTQMLELDCRLTKDLQVAVFHDESLDRCTGCPGKISEYTYDSLPCYLQTLPVHFEPGYVCDRTDLPPSPIVLLQDIFEAFPQMPINIDLKVDDDRLVEMVSSLITNYKRERLTVWGSMRRVTTLKCKRANSSVLTYPPPGVVIGYLIAYRIGLLPFLPIPYDCFELPLVSVLRSKRFLESTGWNSFSARIFALVVDFLISSRGLIHHLKLRGIPVFMWVCNTPYEFQIAFDLGASGIMTDFPSRLRSFLDARPVETAVSNR